MKKNALGRGLDALMPQADYEGSLRDIPVAQIDLNPGQPRKAIDREALEELAQSIRQVGVLQPILVQRAGSRFQIIAGERRFRAARLAGLQSVPCIEKAFDESDTRLAALIENLQREDLNPVDEAQAINSLMKAGGLTQEAAAQRLGKSRSALANALRLLSLPTQLLDMLREDKLSAGHARVLAGLKDAGLQIELAQRTLREGLSVRALEALASRAQQPAPAKQAQRPLPPELSDLAGRLQRATGVRTSATGSLTQGKIQLHYKTAQELQALYQALEGILE